MKSAAIALLLGVSITLPAVAQESAAPTTNWPTTCQSPSRQVDATCIASTVAFRRDSGQKMVEMRVVTRPGEADMVEVIGPFGTSVDAPFRLRAGTSEFLSLPIATCEQDGCHAFAELTADAKAQLAAAGSLAVIFSTPSQGDVVVPLPTSGLPEALEAIAP